MCGLYTVVEQIELGFMFHNFHGLFGFLPYVFDSPITFLTVTIFFSFWEVGERQRTCFSLFPTKSCLKVCVSIIWAHACASLVERIVHVCVQAAGLHVCVEGTGLQCADMDVLNIVLCIGYMSVM